MWVGRSLLRLSSYVAGALAVALVIALGLAAVAKFGWRGLPVAHDGFQHKLWISCYLVGLLSAVLGALGGSSFGRVSDAEARGRALGRVPGAGTWSSLTAATADEPQLTVTAVLLLTGAALIGLGVLLQVY